MNALTRFLLTILAAGGLWGGWCRGAEVDRHAKWEGEISAFEKRDRDKAPPRGGVLFIGSSTIRMWSSLAEDFPGVPVINRGFGGSEIANATHFAPRVIFPYAPRMIFLRAGGNDLWNGRSVEEVFGDFKKFVEVVHQRLPETRIVFISLNPTPARWKQAEKEKALNRLIADHVKDQPLLGYVETYDMVLGPDGKPLPELFLADRLHFNADGYKKLAARVREQLPGR